MCRKKRSVKRPQCMFKASLLTNRSTVRGDKHSPGELRKLAELIRDSESAG